MTLESIVLQMDLVYLDDRIILSYTLNVHLRHVEDVFTVLCIAEVTLKLRTCEFFTDTINYLGPIT